MEISSRLKFINISQRITIPHLGQVYFYHSLNHVCYFSSTSIVEHTNMTAAGYTPIDAVKAKAEAFGDINDASLTTGE
jgi:hypothetical protein